MRALIDRVVGSWRTSAIGMTGTAAALYLFSALGCRWPDPQEWFVVILPALVGIITKERDSAAQAPK